MKKITLLLMAILSVGLLFTQTPQAFKYQTVVRDNSGEAIANQNIGFRIGIIDIIPTGTIVYQETHLVMTNDFGLANLEIGNGTPVSGLMSDINWGNNDKFLQIEMDETGGTNYQLMGTSQLLSVPYALHSETTSDTTRWRKNSDDLYFSNGNVGIGTETPGTNLEIHNTTGAQTRLKLSSFDYSKSLFFTSGSNTFDQSIVFEGGDALRFMKYEQGVGYNEFMRIQNDGNIGVGTVNPDATALLELSSNSKGFLPPRMTSSQISLIPNPSSGLMIFNTDDEKIYIYVEGLNEWKELNYGNNVLPVLILADVQINCASIGVIGNYIAGEPLLQDAIIEISLVAYSQGEYFINTDTINGYSFNASGNFNGPGNYDIILQGSGQPLISQTDVFTATASNNGGICTFDVTVAETPPIDCPSTIIDSRDDQEYSAVIIGNQCWMAKNMNIGTLINGTNGGTNANGMQTNNSTIEKYCYLNIESSCDIWGGNGGLYQWDEAMNYSSIEGAQGICPDGWHIPSDSEWCTLTEFIDSTVNCDTYGYNGSDSLGIKLKSTISWAENGNGTNESGFSAFASGGFSQPLFYESGNQAYFWSSTEQDINNSNIRELALWNFTSNLGRYYYSKTHGFSVRCIKD